MTFIIKVLFFDIILGWGSVIAFWCVALYFCFCGTKSLTNISSEKTRIISHFFNGLPIFVVFYFAVKIFGVPEYMVYDHVKPLKSEYGVVYPAVKLHPLLQFNRFEKEGIITTDLTKFRSNTKAFNAFKVQRRDSYPSLNGFVSYFNGAALFGLGLLWFLFTNRLHNSLATTGLYKRAIETPKIQHFQDYLEASQSVRMFQPFKRKKARAAIKDISNVYNKQLSVYLSLLNQKNPHPIYASMIDQLSRCSSAHPKLYMKVYFATQPSAPEIKILDNTVNFGVSKTMPTSDKLADGFSKILITTLNSFLSEQYVESSEAQADIKLEMPLNVTLSSQPYVMKNGEEKGARVLFSAVKPTAANSFVFNSTLFNYPYSNNKEGTFKTDKWKEHAAVYMSKQFIELFLKGGVPTAAKAESQQSKEQVQTELARITHQKATLFDQIYRESLSAVKGEIVDQVIAAAIQQNSDSFDLIFAETYHLTVTHFDGVFADLLSSSLFSFADSLEGDA